MNPSCTLCTRSRHAHHVAGSLMTNSPVRDRKFTVSRCCQEWLITYPTAVRDSDCCSRSSARRSRKSRLEPAAVDTERSPSLIRHLYGQCHHHLRRIICPSRGYCQRLHYLAGSDADSPAADTRSMIQRREESVVIETSITNLRILARLSADQQTPSWRPSCTGW